MDRTSKSLFRTSALILAIGLLTLVGPGCSRMRTYRAQNSPLPLPRLGLLNRGDEGSILGRTATPAKPDVVWSGEPNLTAPVASLAPPKEPPPGEKIAASSAGTDSNLVELLSLVRTGRDQFARMTTYQVAIRRQEVAGSGLQPEEDVLLSIRNQPKAVRLEWPDGPHKGREVLYSPKETAGMMRIHMPDSMIPVPDLSMAPDSPLVARQSRHPITEAGLDAVLERLESAISANDGGASPVIDAGLETPSELGKPARKIVRKTPRGETWTVFLDPQTGIPLMILEAGANGELLEHDVFRDLKPNEPSLADASAFDPAKRWSTGKGFFGRMAGSPSDSSSTTSARR